MNRRAKQCIRDIEIYGERVARKLFETLFTLDLLAVKLAPYNMPRDDNHKQAMLRSIANWTCTANAVTIAKQHPRIARIRKWGFVVS